MVKELLVQGHRLFVRKLKRRTDNILIGDPDAPVSGFAETILRSMVDKTPSQYCVVLGVGDRCGKPRSKADLKKLNAVKGVPRVPLCIENPAKRGDIVCLPESSPRQLMFRGATGDPDEVFIDESEIEFIIPRESLTENAHA